ncbi:unnamed protein product [Notodromas monacha]|uniref:Negative elongation factor E n=1 Tax=Notodromas monacha TaxID=399045 RepID=A0A7R9BD95_9CRUS|nr:unnamed protein product [Notodromas monacha]CAG0913251.1 unnamed protein product [Notodromas monacha]
MVFLAFPSQLTEEELMLQAKYQKLRKKKKALTTLKTPKVEPEQVPVISSKKRPIEGKDAKEFAKKLLLTGKIVVIPKPEEKTTFKRSLGLERKLSGVESRLSKSPHPAGSPPYNTPRPKQAPTLPPLDPSPPSATPRQNPRGNRNRKRGPDGLRRPGPPIPLDMDAAVEAPPPQPVLTSVPDGRPSQRRGERRTGNTIYVFGYNISEDILRRAFSSFGVILSVSTEAEKNCGFVTFARAEMAEAAIAEMNGSMFADVQLRVSLARRQPIVDPEALAAAKIGAPEPPLGAEAWATIAASSARAAPAVIHQERRGLVTYNDDIF